MPIVFNPASYGDFKLYGQSGFKVDLTSDSWMGDVVNFFKDQFIEELDSPKTAKDSLVIVKEPSHPRVQVLVNNAPLSTQLALPGLIALPPTPDELPVEINIGFLWWEKVLGVMSLVTLFGYMSFIWTKKTKAGRRFFRLSVARIFYFC